MKMQLQFLLLALLACSRFGHSQFLINCYVDCNFEAALQPDPSCALIDSTLDCYFDNQFTCNEDFAVVDVLNDVLDAANNCEATPGSTEVEPTEVTTTESNSGSFQCPASVPLVFDEVEDAIEADILPEPHSCAIPPPDSFRQCSMYTHSHMRPFKGHRTGLETCTVPGEWYLLKHSAFTVVVESDPIPGLNHTQLTKVNVTFFPSSCSKGKSYVATIESPLPQTFTDGVRVNNSDSALQLKHNNSVVSLLAVWINTTIVIRKFSDALSVTMQVPGDVAFFGEGLCLGCPRPAYFNVSKYIETVRTRCPPDTTNNALYGCFFLANQVEFDEIHNNSYADDCTFDVFRTESIDTRKVLNAVAQDAKMLPDVGVVPILVVPSEGPTPLVATTVTVSETPTVSSKPDPDASTTTRSTSDPEDLIGSAASNVSLINRLAVLGLTLVSLILSLL